MTELKLTPGSRYRVTSIATQTQSMVTEGIFRGVASLGTVDALVLEIEDKKKTMTKLIPTHIVVSLEILEAAKDEEREPEETGVHYM